VTPEAVAIIRERARPMIEGRKWKHIAGLNLFGDDQLA
jgi:hypothetical protein